jgi:hypothetical protein
MTPCSTLDKKPDFDLGDADRRNFMRFESPLIIASGDWEQVVDISLSGACVQAKELPQVGDVITMVLTDEVDYHTAMIEAEVMWRRDRQAGLRWVTIDPQERLWLEERCRPGRQLLAHGWLYTGVARDGH